MASLKLALGYLKLGWAVIPVHNVVQGINCTCGREDCPTPGKHPRVSWAKYRYKLPEKGEVEAWFGDEFYGSSIGLVTGTVSDVLVVDLDRKDSLKVARNVLKLPSHTLTARTGGGGKHLFYKLNGREIPSQIAIVPGIDIKSEGGFVVLPPSIHKSGNRYAWSNRMEPISCDLSTLIRKEQASRNGDEWYSELLEGVEQGNRSNATAKLAGRYFGLGLSLDEVILLMMEWNERNAPPSPKRQLLTSIRAIYQKHERELRRTLEVFED